MTDNKIGLFWVSRKLTTSRRWLNGKFDEGKAWIDLIGLAEYKHTARRYRGVVYEVGRGQILITMSELASRWDWERTAVRRFIKSLRRDGDIAISATTRITIISITNYDEYQPNQKPRKQDAQVNDQVNSTSKQPESAKNDQVTAQVPNLIILKREKQTTTESPQKGNRSSRQTVMGKIKGENRRQNEFKDILDPYVNAVDKLAASPQYRPTGRSNYVPPKPIRSVAKYKSKLWQEFIIRQQWGDEAVMSLINSMKETMKNASKIVAQNVPTTPFNWIEVIDHDGKSVLIQTSDPERDDRLYSKTEFGQTVYYKRSNLKCGALAGGN